MPFAYLCDFDGTIAPADIGLEFKRRFTTREPAEGEALIARWRAGRIGNRELAVAECAGLAVDRDQALAFACGSRSIRTSLPSHGRPSSGAIECWWSARGSTSTSGTGWSTHGLADLTWSANRACFEDGRVRLEFPHLAADSCVGCGNCKGSQARRQRDARL